MEHVKHKIWHSRKVTLHRVLHYKQLCEAEAKLNIKAGQKKYAFEYMKIHAGKFVKQGDLLEYCDKRRAEDTNGKKRTFKDNSRAIEALRKDKLPLEWIEIHRDGELWFKYCPQMKHKYTEQEHEKHASKKDSFTKQIIQERMKNAEYRCELTGISVENVGANADHFIPKEKGGKSTLENCVILGEYINTSKNSRMPVEWFCDTILRNFIKLCSRAGMDITAVKEEIINRIKDI